MPTGKELVISIVISFLVVALISISFSSPFYALARPKISYGPITCDRNINPLAFQHGDGTTCCQTQTDQTGLAIKYCTDCKNEGPPPSDCGPRYTMNEGPGNPPTPQPPTNEQPPPPPPPSNALPPSSTSTGNNNNGTSSPTLGSVINAPQSTGNAANPSNNTGGSTAMRLNGVSSPTGYCSRFNRASCIPCDPGLPGGKDTCIPTTDWPPPSIPSAGNAQPPVPPSNEQPPTTSTAPPASTLGPPPSTSSNEQPPATTPTCPDGSAPDAKGNCPTTGNQNPQSLTNNNAGNENGNNNNNLPSQHHKGSDLTGQIGGSTSTKKGNNDNSPTPPPCPTDNSPIPPNCTLKPKF